MCYVTVGFCKGRLPAIPFCATEALVTAVELVGRVQPDREVSLYGGGFVHEGRPVDVDLHAEGEGG